MESKKLQTVTMFIMRGYHHQSLFKFKVLQADQSDPYHRLKTKKIKFHSFNFTYLKLQSPQIVSTPHLTI